MTKYEVTIERIDTVEDLEQRWQSNVNPDGTSGYVMPPQGNTRTVKATIYVQIVEGLDVAALVSSINTPKP